jgi:hypothetical protein
MVLLIGIMTFNPAPFPGDGDAELICTKCGAKYTMNEYRCFAWVAHSDLCVSCGNEAMMQKIADVIVQYEKRLNPPSRPSKKVKR